nr:MAG TPA: hypothetical protein [Caudoviricetes sp.]
MKNLLNCSNHVLGLNQITELQNKGYVVIELPEELKKQWGQLNPENYVEVCNNIVTFMEENNCTGIHLAGFPAAVTLLCIDLNPEVEVIYAYSERNVVEVEVEGQVVKKAIFSHKGFYPYIRSKEDLKNYIK